ncbi:plexin-A2-like [Planococcus citri]|uniref:plexin-A2-like n=1 Tax=Planococcus citri TaxID=170843 RepID=UPI0031F8ED2B
MMFFDRKFIFYAILVLCSKSKNVLLLSGEESPYFDVREFTHHYGIPKLNKLAVNRNTGIVYIGAVNHLYQLSPNLTLQSNISTRPILKFNSSDNEAKNNPKLQMDNYNKILVIDYHHSRLIVCGNVQENPCVIYSTENSISQLNGNQIVEKVNAIDAGSSVVAVVNDVKNENNPNFTLGVVTSRDYLAGIPINIPIYIHVLRKVPSNDKVYYWERTAIHTTAPSDVREERYNITYVYGFYFKNRSWFLKTEESFTSQKSPYISKLVQIPHGDYDYQRIAPTQLPIKCIAGRKHYDLVQAAHVGKPGSLLAKSLNIAPNDDVIFAIFSESQDLHGYSNKPGNLSALCIYSLERICKNITRKGCHPQGPGPLKNEIDFNERCSVSASPTMTFDILLTAINAKANGNNTDLFIGTNTGHVKRIIVKNSTFAYEDDDIEIDEGSPVNSNLLFSPNKDHLYVMTQYRVTKINVKQFNCSLYTTYDHCVMLKGGTQCCGWCGFLNKCTIKYKCDSPNYSSWIEHDFRKTGLILKCNLPKLQLSKSEDLQLYLEDKFLKHINDTFYCNYSIENNTWITTAIIHWHRRNRHQKDYNINCPTPEVKNFTSLQLRQHIFNVTLSISTNHIRDIVTKTYSLSYCNQIDSCRSCVSAPIACHWCSENNQCVYSVLNECPSNKLVTSESTKGGNLKYCYKYKKNNESESRTAESCQVYVVYDACVLSFSHSNCGWCSSSHTCTIQTRCPIQNNSVWIETDFRKTISFKTINSEYIQSGYLGKIELQLIAGNSRIFVAYPNLQCVITVSNPKFELIVEAYMANGTVNCILSKSLQSPTIPKGIHALVAKLSLQTSNLDVQNIWNTNITVFDCQAYSSSGKCIFSTFPCYWCSNTHKCIYNAEKNAKCPNAPFSEIIVFWPLRGPQEGGTNINILGQNLSDPFNNSQHGIRVAGKSCIPQRNNCIAMKKIVCTIEQSSSLQVQGGPVEIQVNGQTLVTSQQNFTFANPEIKSIHPVKGPAYGGTILTITGKNLDVGSSIRVHIGEILCSIFSISPSEMKCITEGDSLSPTSSSNSTEKHPNIKISDVFISYDNTSLKSGSFEYFKDNQRDDKGFNLVPKGIPSGGVEILIHNVNLTRTQALLFVIHHDDKTFHSPCKIQNDSITTLSCTSPPISNVKNELLDPQNPRKMEFLLTNNLSSNPLIDIIHDNISEFLLYPDPEFHHFLNSSIKIDKNNYLIIQGKNINKACQKTDITVIVGSNTCKVLSLSLEQVICVLPQSEQNSFADETEEEDLLSKYHNITILIGENFKRIVPKYTDSKGNEKDLVPVVAIAFTGVVLSIIVYHFIYRKKILAKSLQKLKKMQRQMNQLELCVAAECKEAFTELQTQITTFTSDNSCNSLPFHNYCKYTLKFLFPNLNDHSIILSGKTILIHKEKGLQLFDELIMNKNFLMSFVRTLESDKNFSMNDRVYVASMIMITLQKDMSYCTDILKILMSDLIERNTRSNCHPKLLFRRTESVAEKMLSAWFSFLLHKFLRETAGYPLINLFSAIKQQINKGPVDMITSESRYCLSETKMIRQKIDYHSLTIFVNVSQQAASMIKLQSVEHKFQVRVLDCDTISQVKEKIMDVISPSLSYSQQPNLSEICLEWLTDKPDTMILFDDDFTSKVTGNWRQKNTLLHYGILDGAAFHLISVNEANHRTSHVTSYLSNEHVSKLSSILHVASRKSAVDSTSAQSNEACLKEWHLVEPFNLNDDPEMANNQIVPEIYLTRLLAMKSSLQKFVNDLFKAIFKITHQNNCFPVAIKYMFDFLDDQALQHGITDPEVMHVWKNNCLPLRFWVNLIKNPDFLFDIHKSNPIDSCLSVIAQLLMDSCSTAELHLSKDSATSKLLYAKEIPFYRRWVEKYYADIKKMPKISPQDMSAMLRVESQTHAVGFDVNVSTYELYKYADKYKEKLITALKDDQLVQEDSLALKFQRVLETMSVSWNS